MTTSNESLSHKFLSMIKYLDLFSGGISLNVGGHAVFRTPYGILFSIAYLGIMTYIVISALDKYLDKSKPLAVGEIYSTDIVPEINLYRNKILPVVVAYSNETECINADQINKYFTIKTEKIIWKAVTNNQTQEADIQKIIESYPTIPCSQLTDDQLKIYEYMGTQNFYYQTLKNYGICSVLPKNTTVKGKSSDDYYTIMTLKVLPCSLDSGCATDDEMSEVNFQVILPSSNLDVSNSDNPHKFTIRADEVYYVTPSVRQLYLTKLKEFTVHDYEGIVPTWDKETSVFDIGSVSTVLTSRRPVITCTAADAAINDNLNCLPYFEFHMQSSGNKVTNKRTYVTLSQTLSTIGGMNSVVIIVMLMLYGPINERKRKEYMTRKIYSLIGVKEEDLEKGLEYLEKRKVQAHMTVQEEGSPEKPIQTENAHNAHEKISITTDRKWWRCCCCRKKSDSQVELEQRIKRAHLRIMDSLDVMTIVKNFNQLKVLTHFFFDQRHFDLAQYVGFDLWQAECDEKEKRDVVSHEEEDAVQKTSQRDLTMDRRNLRKVRVSQRILSEKQRFNQWMDFIRHKHNNRTQEDKPHLTEEFTDELDEFYFKKLYPNHGLKTTDGMIDLVNMLMKDEVDPGDIPSIEADDRNRIYVKRRKSTGMARPDLAAEHHNQIELGNRDEDYLGQGKKKESSGDYFGAGFGGVFNNILSQGLPEQLGEIGFLKQSGMTEGTHNIPGHENPDY